MRRVFIERYDKSTSQNNYISTKEKKFGGWVQTEE